MNRKNKKPNKLALHGDTVKTLSAPELEAVDGGLRNTVPTTTTSWRSMQGSCKSGC
jgi:hypothetical protein